MGNGGYVTSGQVIRSRTNTKEIEKKVWKTIHTQHNEHGIMTDK